MLREHASLSYLGKILLAIFVQEKSTTCVQNAQSQNLSHSLCKILLLQVKILLRSLEPNS